MRIRDGHFVWCCTDLRDFTSNSHAILITTDLARKTVEGYVVDCEWDMPYPIRWCPFCGALIADPESSTKEMPS